MRYLFDFIGKTVHFITLFFIDFILKYFYFPKKIKSDKIILIKTDAIGDFIIWLDSARAFSEHFGRQNITLAVNEINYEIAAKMPYWSDIIAIKTNLFYEKIFYRISILKKIKKIHFAKLINFQFSRVFWVDDSISRFISADRKTAFKPDFTNSSKLKLRISDKWYSEIIDIEYKNEHEFIVNAKFLRKLGINYNAKVYEFPNDFFQSIEVDDLPEKYFVVFPGASSAKKEWAKENFVELILQLTHKYQIDCILCGGKNNIETADFIHKSSQNIHNKTGKTNLSQLAYIIKKSEFVVTNDTVAVHLAAALRTKSFCIVGGGHFGRFLPYETEIESNSEYFPVIQYSKMSCFNCNWNCIYLNRFENKAFPCVEAVSVKNVFNTIVENISLS